MTTEATPKKKVFIKTYGCQMNVYDSERMAGLLAPLGYEAADAPDNADLVLLNTCHIREKAAEKVYSELGRLRGLKEKRTAAGGAMMLGVAGCVAQAEGGEIPRRAPQVDLVVGPQSYHRLPELVARASRASGAVLETEFDVEEKFDNLAGPREVNGPTAFVTIQEGCDKFCTFCVVPYTRGAEVSRSVEDVTQEIRLLAQAGVREVTLLGQNVNAYHGAPPAGGDETFFGLGALVRHLAKIEGIERIRFTTSHPRDMDDDLISAFADEPKLMPYLHLPVQAGSDKILKAMNRGHTAEHYLRLIERIRASRPDLALSGDFIVGFPGETEADFLETLQVVETVGYASAFSFKYSRRPGTPGAVMGKQVAEPEKDDRLARLQAVLRAQQEQFNAQTVGQTLPALFEKKGRHSGQLVGRSPYLQSIHAEAPDSALGEIMNVRITAAKPNSLEGRLEGAS